MRGGSPDVESSIQPVDTHAQEFSSNCGVEIVWSIAELLPMREVASFVAAVDHFGSAFTDLDVLPSGDGGAFPDDADLVTGFVVDKGFVGEGAGFAAQPGSRAYFSTL